ncbi:WecB/TagA/CpsF family glycosyltransferase [Pseudonocardia lacus]|uniref:WecB/TagA/CpsF family glycosyltransferase n=1 Tax=Pseudonocardia lacus TaxID=2835865 RepID=UPI001BDCED97|nr:WecB/TagA/CpsF family glycosyltransferase [Pseudonocardia lacus]
MSELASGSSTQRSELPTVTVAGVDVVDAAVADILGDVRRAVTAGGASPQVYFALHVGGLRLASDPAFVRLLNSARATYADGMSVVLLAKLAGARRIERAGTTDIGIPIIRTAQAALGRPLRVALVGGPPGLAVAAGAVLNRVTGCDVCLAADGFAEDSGPLLTRLADAAPDLLVVGMGMPTEARWVHQHLDRIAAPLVLTCGGWMGFLTGREKRAPAALQRAGLEWTYRLAQDPRRLVRRYAGGAVVWVRLAVATSRS